MLNRVLTCLFVLGLVLALPGMALAESDILAPVDTSSFQAADRATDLYFGGFDVQGTEIACWGGISGVGSELRVVDRTTGTRTDLGAPADGYSGYNSFVAFSPIDSSFYVGFTVGDNSDDRIYQVDRAGTWTHIATLAGNFDLEFAGNNPFVSGLHDESGNAIWLLDTTGANNHDKLIEIGGYSAGLGVDTTGNVFYASSDSALYRWDAADVAGAIGGTSLTNADGTKLADLEAGAYDTEVDAAGNVLFTVNGSRNITALWNGTEGDGQNYDALTLGAGEWGNWHTLVKSTGDIHTPGEAFYVGDFYFNGVAEVSAVPEPSTLALLLAGVVFLAFRRK